jgi:peptide/histidine transporter 3/4
MHGTITISWFQEPNQLIYTGDGSVDFKGNPVVKERTGRWKACPFILGNHLE